MAKWLAKANDTVVSHCTCEHAIAATPSQLDCPWCGCGWLISCASCGKAFTFAEVVEVDRGYRDLVRAEVSGGRYDGDLVDDLAIWMENSVAPFGYGETIVYLDGMYLRESESDVKFVGWFAKHDLRSLPFTAAKVKNDLDDIFGDPDYWFERERPDRHEE